MTDAEMHDNISQQLKHSGDYELCSDLVLKMFKVYPNVQPYLDELKKVSQKTNIHMDELVFWAGYHYEWLRFGKKHKNQ